MISDFILQSVLCDVYAAVLTNVFSRDTACVSHVHDRVAFYSFTSLIVVFKLLHSFQTDKRLFSFAESISN